MFVYVRLNRLQQEKENMDPKVSMRVCTVLFTMFSSCLYDSIMHFAQGCAQKSCARMYNTNPGCCMGI